MKKISLLLILFLFLCIDAFSQKVAYAVFKDSTLTFYYNDKKPKGAYGVENLAKDSYGFECKEWEPVLNKIRTVVFDKSFKEYRPKSCSRWFMGCGFLDSIKGIKENLNTSEVTDMHDMFVGCKNLTSLDVSGFKTDKVTDMSEMFYDCNSLTSLDVSGFKTDKVTDMSGMFLGCSKLTSLDVSGFNTDNVTNMSIMFWNCVNLTSLDVSGFNTKNVTDMQQMFSYCENLTSLDVSGFNTDKVTDMSWMFHECHNLTSLDVSGFNTENVTDMSGMFLGCENLKTIYVGDGWNTSKVLFSEDMFKNSPNLVGGQGTEFNEKHTDVEYAHIDGGESNPGYLTKKTK